MSTKTKKVKVPKNLSKYSINILKKVKKQILKEPMQFGMEYWFEHLPDIVPNCGTTACIGGWALAIVRKQKPFDCQNAHNFATFRQVLGFADDSSGMFDRLCFVSFWPEPYRTNLHKVKSFSEDYAKVAADRIDFFIKTDGSDSL